VFQVGVTRGFNRGSDIYPWPHRFGFVALYAAFIRLTGRPAVETGELMSLLASLAAIAIAGAIGFGELGPWAGVMAMLFLAVSPLDLALARRAWQDAVTGLFATAMLWSFLRARAGGRAGQIAFFAIGGFGLLVKESLVIPYALGAAGLVWLEWRRSRGWREPARVLAIAAAVALGAFAIDVAVNGGWRELRTTMELIREPDGGDEYDRHYQTGGVGYYLTGMRILQPQLFLLGYVAAALALFWPRGPLARIVSPQARSTLIVLAVYLAVFSAIAFSFPSKNLRFLSPIFATCALLGASLIQSGARVILARSGGLRGRIGIAVIAIALVALAARDVTRFHFYFIENELQDLATPWFIEVDSGKL
jgi:4-amino-4-deoxy-L-arabinose transferase-like glycosyltransferase